MNKRELKDKPGWLGTLWNVNPGLAERAEKELIEHIDFTREIIFRNQLSMPTDEQEIEWFEQGMSPEVGARIIKKTIDWNPSDYDNEQ